MSLGPSGPEWRFWWMELFWFLISSQKMLETTLVSPLMEYWLHPRLLPIWKWNVSVLPSHSLWLIERWMCFTAISNQKAVFNFLSFFISDPARVGRMLRETYLPAGMEGVIFCPVQADPPVLYVNWTKDGNELNLDNVNVSTCFIICANWVLKVTLELIFLFFSLV